MVFGQNVVLRHPHKIRIGDNVVVDDNCLIDAKGDANAGIMIGSGVFVGRNTILSCKNGDIVVGDGANIGFNCEVFSASRVSIGRDTLLAAYAYLIGGDHDLGRRRAAGCCAGSSVSRDYGRRRMLIGAGAKVLDGVEIGDGAIVGAGAVVRSAVAAAEIVAGYPLAASAVVERPGAS